MKHLVVGAGPAGLVAAETLRALEPDAQIALVCDERPYARMVLPYYLAGRIPEEAVFTGDDAWLAELGLETHLGRRVQSLDPAGHAVVLDDGARLDYDRLLLATGSRVAQPPIQGLDRDGVVPMWTLDHARDFLSGPHDETVIVGAGFIAFTILDGVVARSRKVTFLELEDQILPRMLDAKGAAALQAHLEAAGIDVRTGEHVERIETEGGRRVLHLAGGASLAADCVILATGIQPNLEFLEGSGIATDHAIVVDERMQTSAADVYAAGDVAQGPALFGGAREVRAIQPVAVDHGRVAAANMAGRDVRYDGALTINILAAQGLEATSFGRWSGTADTTIVDNPADRIYRKFVWDADVLVGGILIGPTLAVSGTNDVGMLKGLVQTGVALGPWRAYLEENPLDLRRPYVASGAASKLLASTLLAGSASTGGGFRFPSIPARKPKPTHHAVLRGGAPA